MAAEQNLNQIFSLQNLGKPERVGPQNPEYKWAQYLLGISKHQTDEPISEQNLINKIFDQATYDKLTNYTIRGLVFEHLVYSKLQNDAQLRSKIIDFLPPSKSSLDISSPVVRNLTLMYQKWCASRGLQNVDGLITEYNPADQRLYVVAAYEVKSGAIKNRNQIWRSMVSLYDFLDDINSKIVKKPLRCGPISLQKKVYQVKDLKKIILTNVDSPLTMPDADIDGYDGVIPVYIDYRSQQELAERIVKEQHLVLKD